MAPKSWIARCIALWSFQIPPLASSSHLIMRLIIFKNCVRKVDGTLRMYWFILILEYMDVGLKSQHTSCCCEVIGSWLYSPSASSLCNVLTKTFLWIRLYLLRRPAPPPHCSQMVVNLWLPIKSDLTCQVNALQIALQRNYTLRKTIRFEKANNLVLPTWVSLKTCMKTTKINSTLS